MRRRREAFLDERQRINAHRGCLARREIMDHLESARLRALYGYSILDTPPEPNFNRITHLAAVILDLPVCTLSLADAERHWFKSRYGVTATELPRRMSFCDETIRSDDVFIVPDALAD